LDSVNARLQDKDYSSKESNRLISSKENEIDNLNKRILNSEEEITRLRKEKDDLNMRLSEKDLKEKRIHDENEHNKSRNETMQKVI